MGNNFDWDLSTCCGTSQIVVMVSIGVAFLFALVYSIWRIKVLKPFKLLCTFLHELGHATATWMTCGHVEAISVDTDEGGVTKTRGGVMCCILPAGYLGSSFWGGFFMLMGAAGKASDEWTPRIAAGVMILIMLYVMIFKAEGKVIRLVMAFFIIVVVGVWVAKELWSRAEYALIAFLVFFGAMNTWFALCDIFEDTISRKVEESDAFKFAELTHTSSRCWGVIWWIIAFGFMGACVYLSIVLSGLENED